MLPRGRSRVNLGKNVSLGLSPRFFGGKRAAGVGLGGASDGLSNL